MRSAAETLRVAANGNLLFFRPSRIVPNPIDSLFVRLRAAKQKAFMPFVTAGDPDLGFTQSLLRTVAGSGADLIEVGFPFSDPIADGPVIQASYTRALKHKLKLTELFASVGEVANAPGWTTPLVAMASYSLIFKRGAAEFLKQSQAAGFSGAVVPDLPAEEAEELAKHCREVDFKLILLVSPTTAAHRIDTVVKACSGFVYVVSLVGITGERASISPEIEDLLARLRKATDLPLCVGFGVSRPEQVKMLRDHCDGVIVGSALVKELEKATTPAERESVLANVAAKVQILSAALRET